jgi:NhaP-type Na+/H+ or K+/H+ antiporter
MSIIFQITVGLAIGYGLFRVTKKITDKIKNKPEAKL